jgi:hypothetical protein
MARFAQPLFLLFGNVDRTVFGFTLRDGDGC